jgi:hypothetical protein
MSQQPSASQSSMFSSMSSLSFYDQILYKQERSKVLGMRDSFATVSDKDAALEWAEEFLDGCVRLFPPISLRAR